MGQRGGLVNQNPVIRLTAARILAVAPPKTLPLTPNSLFSATAGESTLSTTPDQAFVANFKRYSAAETRFIKGKATAAEIVGEITPGMCRLCITIGHADLTHVLLHIAQAIGPCELVISTWDVATNHLALVRTAADTGVVIRVRWVLDNVVACYAIANDTGIREPTAARPGGRAKPKSFRAAMAAAAERRRASAQLAGGYAKFRRGGF